MINFVDGKRRCDRHKEVQGLHLGKPRNLERLKMEETCQQQRSYIKMGKAEKKIKKNIVIFIFFVYYNEHYHL